MFKKIAVVFILIPFLLGGCAYQRAIEGQEKARQAHALSLSNMPMAYSMAIEKITAAFKDEYLKSRVENQPKFTEKIFFDTNGRPTHSEITYMPRNDLVDFLIAEKKQKTMEMLFASLTEVYQYNEWEDPEATTWEGVAMTLVKQGPLMLAIGGLWNIGLSAVNGVGDSSWVNEGNYNNGSGQIGDNITTTTTIDTVTN